MYIYTQTHTCSMVNNDAENLPNSTVPTPEKTTLGASCLAAYTQYNAAREASPYKVNGQKKCTRIPGSLSLNRPVAITA